MKRMTKIWVVIVLMVIALTGTGTGTYYLGTIVGWNDNYQRRCGTCFDLDVPGIGVQTIENVYQEGYRDGWWDSGVCEGHSGGCSCRGCQCHCDCNPW